MKPVNVAGTAGLLALIFLAVVFNPGCSEEESSYPFEAAPDTSFLRVFDIGYRAISNTEQYNSGVHIWWKEYFFSNYNKNCSIERYIVLNSIADTIYDQTWQNRLIHTGDTNIGRTKWIDLPDSVVVAMYQLKIMYHHSKHDFEFDTTFEVFVNYPDDIDTL